MESLIVGLALLLAVYWGILFFKYFFKKEDLKNTPVNVGKVEIVLVLNNQEIISFEVTGEAALGFFGEKLKVFKRKACEMAERLVEKGYESGFFSIEGKMIPLTQIKEVKVTDPVNHFQIPRRMP